MALGFTEELYDKYFAGLGPENKSAETRWWKISTPLFNEMDLVFTMRFRGMKEWSELSWIERRAWMYYHILAGEKRTKNQDEAQEQAKLEQRAAKDLPQVERTPRVKSR